VYLELCIWCVCVGQLNQKAIERVNSIFQSAAKAHSEGGCFDPTNHETSETPKKRQRGGEQTAICVKCQAIKDSLTELKDKKHSLKTAEAILKASPFHHFDFKTSKTPLYAYVYFDRLFATVAAPAYTIHEKLRPGVRKQSNENFFNTAKGAGKLFAKHDYALFVEVSRGGLTQQWLGTKQFIIQLESAFEANAP
jgi:hypothetical protein